MATVLTCLIASVLTAEAAAFTPRPHIPLHLSVNRVESCAVSPCTWRRAGRSSGCALKLNAMEDPKDPDPADIALEEWADRMGIQRTVKIANGSFGRGMVDTLMPEANVTILPGATYAPSVAINPASQLTLPGATYAPTPRQLSSSEYGRCSRT